MNDFNILNIPSHSVHIFKNKKVIYFADPFFTAKVDTIKQEYEEGLKNELHTLNLEFPNIKLMDTPPFNEDFDILFFDYGGMSLGNDLLGSFCRHIIRTASNYPNRYYVMVSTFTKWAMKDAKEGYTLPNIYLTIDEFAEQFKKDNNL